MILSLIIKRRIEQTLEGEKIVMIVVYVASVCITAKSFLDFNVAPFKKCLIFLLRSPKNYYNFYDYSVQML
jgi:hypothetical protein